VISCYGIFTPQCAALIGPPQPVQTCVSAWENCSGFGGSKPTKGKIDLSGFPATVKKPVGCQESSGNPFAARPAPRETADGVLERAGLKCVLTTYLETTDPKAKADATKKVRFELNLRLYRSELEQRHAVVAQGILEYLKPREDDDTATAEWKNSLSLTLNAAVDELYEKMKNAKLKPGFEVGAQQACALVVGEQRDGCVDFIERLNSLVDRDIEELGARADELGLTKGSSGGHRVLARRAKRSAALYLGGGRVEVAQGAKGTLKLQFSKQARGVLKKLRKRGVKKLKARAVTIAGIVPGVESTGTKRVTINLAKKRKG
jgi:hypothetical protein